jgi:hypothetical protein
MPRSNNSETLRSVAQFLIDSFNLDLQVYMTNALEELRAHPAGADFAEWAQANPAAFKNTLRLMSGLIERIPRNDSLLLNAATNMLAMAPYELFRTFSLDFSPIRKGATPLDGNSMDQTSISGC